MCHTQTHTHARTHTHTHTHAHTSHFNPRPLLLLQVEQRATEPFRVLLFATEATGRGCSKGELRLQAHSSRVLACFSVHLLSCCVSPVCCGASALSVWRFRHQVKPLAAFPQICCKCLSFPEWSSFFMQVRLCPPTLLVSSPPPLFSCNDTLFSVCRCVSQTLPDR